MIIKQEYEFWGCSRENIDLHNCEWNNKKLKRCGMRIDMMTKQNVKEVTFIAHQGFPVCKADQKMNSLKAHSQV